MPCRPCVSDKSGYSVALLGDTHFDAEPESVYHAHYDGSDKHAAIHRAEFRRNGKMWRGPCRDMLAASGTVSRELKTDMVLQLGDLIQGDCGNPVIHRKMLDDCVAMFRGAYPSGLPFLTVLGNHDVRGKGARKAYNGFVGDFVSEMAGCAFRYPVASFRRGDDLWVFCDFEMK